MLSVEPGSLGSAKEELTAVRVRTSIGHGEDAGADVFKCEVLILELGAVDGLSTSSVADSEITSLAHESGDDSMELAAFECEWLSHLPHSLLSRTQRAKVLGSLRHHILSQLHLNTTCWLSAYLHVEEHDGVGRVSDGVVARHGEREKVGEGRKMEEREEMQSEVD